MRLSFLASVLVLAVFASTSALAHDDEEPKNLKVLKNNGKNLEKGMKDLTKGLGVKCDACHVKGKFDADDKESKLKSRDFFTATIGEKDQAKRDAALADLLKVLAIEKAKDAKTVWSGVGMLEKK